MTSEPTVFYKPDCPFCARLRTDLQDAGIAHTLVDVEQDEQAGALVSELNGGHRIVPTMLFADGSSLTNPPIAEVVAKLETLAAAR